MNAKDAQTLETNRVYGAVNVRQQQQQQQQYPPGTHHEPWGGEQRINDFFASHFGDFTGRCYTLCTVKNRPKVGSWTMEIV